MQSTRMHLLVQGLVGVFLFLSVGSTCAQAPMTAGDATKKFDTVLGTLSEGGVLEAGSQFDLGGNAIFAVLAFPKGSAVALDEARFDICLDYGIEPPPSITLVQDSTTGKWLVTDGRLGMLREQLVLVEGHTVKIIGGEGSPIHIGDKPFFDTTVVIEGGRPVVNETAEPEGSQPTVDETAEPERGQTTSHRSSGLPIAATAVLVLAIAAAGTAWYFRRRRTAAQASAADAPSESEGEDVAE